MHVCDCDSECCVEARKAIVLLEVHQHFEEKNKGSLEVDKLADMVIHDRNPLAVDPMTIKDIKVVETFGEGKTVCAAKQALFSPCLATSITMSQEFGRIAATRKQNNSLRISESFNQTETLIP